MSIGAVALERGRSRWLSTAALAPVTAEPEAIAAHLRHSASRGVVVLGGDLVALIVPAAVIVPNPLQWWVPTFMAAVVVLSALKGSYRTRITMSVARDVSAVVTCVAVPLVLL